MHTTRQSVSLRSTSPAKFGSGGQLTNSRLATTGRWALLPLLLIAGFIAFLVFTQRPTSLADYALVGARSPACVRTVVLRDQSGSMSGFEAARESAMQQLIEWSTAPDTLRPDDELAIIDFADNGVVALPTATVESLGTTIPGDQSASGGTELGAGILAMKTLPTTECTTSLIVLSDGFIPPLSGEAENELTAQGITHVALVLPAAGGAPAEWRSEFPYAIVVAASASDADQTAQAVGEALAVSVGQRLERR